MRAAQVEGIQFDLAAHQLPPVESDGRTVHRDLGFFGKRFGAQPYPVEDEPLDRAESHALELQSEPGPRRGVEQQGVQRAGKPAEMQNDQRAWDDEKKEHLRDTQKSLQRVVREDPPRHESCKVSTYRPLVRRGASGASAGCSGPRPPCCPRARRPRGRGAGDRRRWLPPSDQLCRGPQPCSG